MKLILQWSIVPVLVMVSAFCIAIVGWFEIAWVAPVFLLAEVIALSVWRRATYRLKPSMATVDMESVPPEVGRSLTWLFAIIFGGTLALMLLVVVLLSMVSSFRSPTGFSVVFAVLIWGTITKMGAVSVLGHRVLSSQLIPSKK